MTTPPNNRQKNPQDWPHPTGTPYLQDDPAPGLAHGIPARAPAAGPRRGYVVTRTVGAVVALGLVGTAAVSAVPEMLRTTTVHDLALADSVQRLVLDPGVGEVQVREAAAGEALGVQTSQTYSGRQPEVNLTQGSDGTARLDASCPRIIGLGTCSIDWEIVVPAGTDLEINSSIGDVDIHSTGSVQVQGATGDIRLSGAPTQVDLTLSIGDVRVETDAPADSLRVRSSLGDVTLALPEGPYQVHSQTSLGTERLSLDTEPDAPYVVDVQTSLGDILVYQQ